MSTKTHGACLCGAVTFAIAPPYRWFAHCHCSMCRKHGGTLFGSGLGVARDRFHWLSGTRKIVHYRASAAFERPFCGVCGSPLPALSHDERYWHVPAGLLADDPGTQPRSHIFVGSKSPLFEIRDALPQHAGYPPGMDLPAIERRAAVAPRSGGVIGGCLCAAVAFAVATTPRRVINCHCSLCRRQTGGAFTSILPAPRAELRWLRGKTNVRHYALPAPRCYSADFCADCGSALPATIEIEPTTMLPAGSIDSDLPALPAVHIYVGSKALWYTIEDDWPRFDELPPKERLTEFLG